MFPYKSSTVLYVANMTEDVWPFIAAMSDDKERKLEIEENALLAERDFFAFGGVKQLFFLSPIAVDPLFLEYFQKCFGRKQIQVFTPRKHTGLTSTDALADSVLRKHLIVKLRKVKRLVVIAYGTSPEFLRFLQFLRREHIAFTAPETPQKEKRWFMHEFGTKVSIRSIHRGAEKEKDFRMAADAVCYSVRDAIKEAARRYASDRGVVIKTNKGHAGAGLLIFRDGDLTENRKASEKKLAETFRANRYWQKFPIVVEGLLAEEPTIGGGSPSVEFLIEGPKTVRYLYPCGMRITPEGVFRGIEIGREAMPAPIANTLRRVGAYIGRVYAAGGYRGFFDVDFVVTPEKVAYVTESNVRRTGGTHLYMTALALFGPRFLDRTYLVSNNLYNLPTKSIKNFGQLRGTLGPILYSKQTKEGLLICSSGLLRQRRMSYIIFGKTKMQTYEIERKMENLLQRI